MLVDGTGLVENYQYYLATSDMARRHPEVIGAVVDELRVVNDWADGHRDEVARFLADLPRARRAGVADRRVAARIRDRADH